MTTSTTHDHTPAQLERQEDERTRLQQRKDKERKKKRETKQQTDGKKKRATKHKKLPQGNEPNKGIFLSYAISHNFRYYKHITCHET